MSAFISKEIQYNALSHGARAASGAGTRFLLLNGWRLFYNKKPPVNPATPGVLWSEALLYGALSGMVAGILGVVARRLATTWWRNHVGARPGDTDV